MLVQLADAALHVGRADVTLAAVVQQISRGRRAAAGGASRAFFKLTVQVKAFRGSVEAQFAPAASRAQLLFRGDRFFATRDVRLAALYPLIEWSKQHRHELLFAQGDGASQDSGGGTRSVAAGSGSSGGDTSCGGGTRRARTKIRDLREHMVADVVCRVRERRSDRGPESSRPLLPPPPLARQRRAVDATDLGGVLLREVVLQDSTRDWIVANLWDQHAEAKFVARLLAHPGLVELRGVVVSLDADAHQLLANATPQTQIDFLVDPTATTADADVRAVERRLGRDLEAARRPCVVATFEELESQVAMAAAATAAAAVGIPSDEAVVVVVVDSVCVERIRFGTHLGSVSRVMPQFVQRLVESYCSVCDDALPELNVDAAPPVYGPCAKRCRVRSGRSKEPLWRYRRLQMELRDSHEQRLRVDVESDALVELVGNIRASMVVRPVDVDGAALPFDVRSAVVSLLNALADGGEQTFRAEVRCIRGASQTSCSGSQRFQHSEPSQVEDTQNQSHPHPHVQQQQSASLFTLASLVPSQSRHLIV